LGVLFVARLCFFGCSAASTEGEQLGFATDGVLEMDKAMLDPIGEQMRFFSGGENQISG
jgi:hypothetical protein